MPKKTKIKTYTTTRQVLDALSKGELTIEQAERQLESLKRVAANRAVELTESGSGCRY